VWHLLEVDGQCVAAKSLAGRTTTAGSLRRPRLAPLGSGGSGVAADPAAAGSAGSGAAADDDDAADAARRRHGSALPVEASSDTPESGEQTPRSTACALSCVPVCPQSSDSDNNFWGNKSRF